MDPANYERYSLPQIEYTEMDDSRTYYLVDDYQCDQFYELFKTYIGFCCAITRNDEIIFNKYPKLTIREDIIEEMIRSHMYEELASVIKETTSSTSRIIIYIGKETPTFVACYFKDNFVTVEFYKSYKFMQNHE